jgi:hypothetical protein
MDSSDCRSKIISELRMLFRGTMLALHVGGPEFDIRHPKK